MECASLRGVRGADFSRTVHALADVTYARSSITVTSVWKSADEMW
jgi:hypothetical protein